MTTGIVEVSDAFGGIISQAVRAVGKEPEEYDLWYHDAPIWLLQRKRSQGRAIRVSRVQITPCLLKGKRVLLVQPDVQLLSRRGERVVRSLDESVSSALSQTLPLDLLCEQYASGDKEVVRSRIARTIAKVWRLAETLEDDSIGWPEAGDADAIAADAG